MYRPQMVPKDRICGQTWEVDQWKADLRTAIQQEEQLVNTLTFLADQYRVSQPWLTFVFERHLPEIKTHLGQLKYNLEEIERAESLGMAEELSGIGPTGVRG